MRSINKLPMSFKTNTPVLPDVKVTDAWGFYDGVLFGICEVRGKEFFFLDIIYDIWRFYEDDTHQRLWSIFAVYDIEIEKAEQVIGSWNSRDKWQEQITEESECIGIFWEYEKAGKFKKWSEQ